jgi:hypothetical protein
MSQEAFAFQDVTFVPFLELAEGALVRARDADVVRLALRRHI